MKPSIKRTENSVIIEDNYKRYEVYFDTSKYQIFVGQPQEGFAKAFFEVNK